MFRKLLVVLALALLAGCEEDDGISTGVVIIVQAPTFGQNLDDSYDVNLNGSFLVDVPANGQRLFGLGQGIWTFELTDVAANCAVDGENPRDVEAELPQVTIVFTVNCT